MGRMRGRLAQLRQFVSDSLAHIREALVDRPFRPGRLLGGRYQVRRVLGMGSYGISYLCEDRRDGRRCVVKQVRPSKRGGRKGEPVFEREAAVLERLAHPAIPRLIDRFADGGGLFLVMEYKHGRNLEDALFADNRTFSTAKALRVLRELCDIVAYVHRRGFVHRDVRIPNVMIGDDGRLALIDFGLACPVGDHAAANLDADRLNGYPEEKKIRREPVFASDFYAMGHLLLFLLYAGYEAKPGQPEGSWEEELDLPPRLRAFIRRLLQLDEPYGDIGDVIRELDGLILETERDGGDVAREG
jgi:serine/threonine-protein kinase